MDAFLNDLKQSLRMFWQSRAFTAAAVSALALGIGANTAIFSVVNAVLLRPMTYPDADRLVILQTTSNQGPAGGAGSPAKFQHLREQSDVVREVSAFNQGVVNYTGGEVPEQLRSGRVSRDFFSLFGTRVLMGRTFNENEDRPDGEKAVVLSHQTWTRRFDSDPNVLGKVISLSGVPHVVVGVLDKSADFQELFQNPDVWIPFQLDPNTKDQGHYFRVAGRLAPGVTIDQAKAKLQLSGEAFRQKFPAFNKNNSFGATLLGEALVANVRTSLFVLVGAVSFVLLIACANVANLLLVRATGRRRELAVRAAIGANRSRIVRQLLTESVVLSIAGGILGSILGIIGIRLLLAVNTANLPRIGQDGALVGVDWRVLLFTLLVSLGTGVIFGLIPALQGSRTDLSATLKETGGRSGTGFKQNKVRSVLVVVEVALALILLVGSALLIRTAAALGRVNPGFDASRVLTMRMSLTGPRFQTSQGVESMVRDGVERLRAVPGVVAASATCCVPLQGGYGLPFVIVGRPLDGPAHGGGSWVTLSPGYFDVFKIPIKRGRDFNERDTQNSPGVVIINEAMARQFWQNGDPLNDRLVIGRSVMREFSTEPERQIVGIVGDVRNGSLDSEPGPMMYVPQAQLPDAANALNVGLTPIAWVVRTQVEPFSVSQAVQEQLRQASGLPVSQVRTMSEVVSLSTSRQQFNMWLMTAFGACALLLAAIGIYGLMAYAVQQRTQEIGIRLALGAPAHKVKNMVVVQGMTLAIVGVIVGLGLAYYLARFIATSLYGVQQHDKLVFIGVPLLLAFVALIAVWLPARRASRIDPIIALRAE
ncbi:MAG TPA: ABC transporter permease [Vicinamibacterales bacterium]|jgi:predicted permease